MRAAVPALDVDVNELALVYRARGMSETEAAKHADEILGKHTWAMTGQFGFAAVTRRFSQRHRRLTLVRPHGLCANVIQTQRACHGLPADRRRERAN